MSKIAREPKQQGANAQLRESVKRLEGRVAALEVAITQHASRLDAVEVVKAGPQEPDYPQRPETS